jgi:hypothetical protein
MKIATPEELGLKRFRITGRLADGSTIEIPSVPTMLATDAKSAVRKVLHLLGGHSIGFRVIATRRADVDATRTEAREAIDAGQG